MAIVNIIPYNVSVKDTVNKIKSYIETVDKENLDESIFLIHCNRANTHSLEIRFYSETLLIPKEADPEKEVIIYLREGPDLKPVILNHYDTYIPEPSCLNFVEMNYLELIISQMKSLPLFISFDDSRVQLYSDVWKSWDTILKLNKKYPLSDKMVL